MSSVEQPTRIRAALYLRVSSTGQSSEDRYSIPTQEDACRAWTDAHDADVTHVFREVYSGEYLWERPDLTSLRELVRHHEIDVVVCHEIDRYSRDPVHLGVLVSEAEHHGVDVQFVLTPLDNTPEGQLIRFVRGYAAKVELLKIRERSNRGRRARVQSGKLAGCHRVLYGYLWRDAEKTGYAIDPLTAPVVQLIFRLAAEGWSLRRIGAMLDSEGVPTPAGRIPGEPTGRDDTSSVVTWRTVMIRRILTHPAYAGQAVAYRWRVETQGTTRQGTQRRVAHLRNEQDQIALPDGTIPALVSEELFLAVGERLKRNKAESPRNNHDPEATLLRGGYVRCHYCGHAMLAQSWRGRYRYVCPKTDVHCPRPTTIDAHILDAAVWQAIYDTATDPESIEKHLHDLQTNDPTTADLAAVDRALADVARKQANGARALLDMDEDTAEPVRVQLAALAERKRSLDADRDAILGRRRGWEAAQAHLHELQQWCRNLGDNLEDASYARKRQVLHTFKVRVDLFRPDDAERWIIHAEPEIADAAIVETTARRCVHKITLRWTGRDGLEVPALAAR